MATDNKIKKNPGTNIGYSGKVTLTIKKDGKVLSRYKSHNIGYQNLFYFIANALAGNLAVNARPCKIRLFSLADGGTDTPGSPVFNESCSMSNYVLYGSTPYPEYDDGTDSCSLTYHFIIPNAYIVSGSNGIYKAALYPNNVTDVEKDMYASFLFTKEVEEEESSSYIDWDPQTLPASTGNYVLLLDWTVAIGNRVSTEQPVEDESTDTD